MSNDIIISANDKRQYKYITLSNDLSCVLVSDPDSEKSACCCDVAVGAMSDPDEAQGLAHFLEHMLFMGTTTYPEENAYQAFLAAHGGSSNAYTAQENTVYYFDVQSDQFEKALDIFASFFICPLFADSSTNREMNAVDSENSKNLQVDGWRSYQLMKSLAKSDHPFSKFSTGNLKTLSEEPQAKGLNTRDLLLEFYEKYYSSNVMKVCIYGKESIETLESWAIAKFQAVPNKGYSRRAFASDPYGPAEMSKIVRVVPIKDSKSLDVGFLLPSLLSRYKCKPQKYVAHLLGHESGGSILAALKLKGWANGLSASLGHSHNDFSILDISVELTDEGSNQIDNIMTCIFCYIGMLQKNEPIEWIGKEIEEIMTMNFQFLDKSKPISYVCKIANNMQLYEPAHTVCGDYIILEPDISYTSAIVDKLRPANCLVFHNDKKWFGKTSKNEKWYNTEYDEIPFTAEQIHAWEGALKGDTVSDCGWSNLLALPGPNPFVPTEFGIRASNVAVESSSDVLNNNNNNNSNNHSSGVQLIEKGEVGVFLDESVFALPSADGIDLSGITIEESSSKEGNESDKEVEAGDEADEGEDGEEGEEGEGGAAATSGDANAPMQIIAGQSTQTWYKPDTLWKVPKLNVVINLETNQATCTPLAVAMCDLLANFLKELLNEFAYYADCAGLHYDVNLSKNGLDLVFFGYNHKMPVLVAKTLLQLKEIGSANGSGSVNSKHEDIFARLKEMVLRNYYNSLFWPPYYTCIHGSAMCLEEPRWSNSDKHSALRAAGFGDFCAFARAFIHSLKSEVFIHGNASKEEARELASSIAATLGSLPLSNTQEPIRRVVHLEKGVHYVYRQHGQHFNPEEPNSAIENIYLIDQLAGADTLTVDDGEEEETRTVDPRLKNEALGQMLVQMMVEQAFDQLRTKEQLGYIVFTGIKKINQLTGLQIIVQSNHKPPEFLDGRIEEFLKTYRTILEEMSEEELNSFRQATIKKLNEKPKNLSEESRRFGEEISQNTYLFSRRSILSSILPTITRTDILQFYDQFVAASSPERRKFSSCFFGKGTKFATPFVASPAAGVRLEVIRDPSGFKRKMALLPEMRFDSCIPVDL